LLITFEGIDGCGKTTQINNLTEYLKSRNLQVTVFREPGGTVLSEKIRDLLLHETDEMDFRTELLLFSAARSQLVVEKVIPLLNKGQLVILDRYYDSTVAYQGYGRNSIQIDHIHFLNNLATHNTIPDITFYLSISPDIASKRTQNSQKDRMEKAGTAFFERVKNGYDLLAEKNDRFITIDSSRDPETVFQDIKSAFDSEFSSR
jgi:dTMP kinase